MNIYFNILIALFLFGSCTKEIEINLNGSNPQIVIEGNISDNPGPYLVKITKSVNFNNANDYPPVSGAFVVISDDTGVIDTLIETISGLYQTQKIEGTQGRTYKLKVFVEGNQYDAVSTMPYKVNLDSIKFNADLQPGESDTTFSVVPIFLDPAAYGNSYRFFFSSNGVPDKAYQVSNDNIGNGSINAQPFFTEDLKIFKGDTVTVSMLCIDINTYNYFYTLSQIGDGGPISGAIPTNPPSNINGNNALGIFAAFTTMAKTAIAQ